MEHIQFVHVFYYTTVWYVAFLFFIWGTVIFYIGSQGQKLSSVCDLFPVSSAICGSICSISTNLTMCPFLASISVMNGYGMTLQFYADG